MGGKTSIATKQAEILREWMRRLIDQRVVMGKSIALEAQFTTWLSLLASDEDIEPLDELHRLVAIHSRNLGLQKRPASASLRQILCLGEALRATVGPMDDWLQRQIDALMLIVCDAHFLGRTQQLEHSWINKIRDYTPIVQIDSHTVLAFLFLPLSTAVLDACYGRLLKLVHMVKASRAIIDISMPDLLNDRFFDTTKALLMCQELEGVQLILTGVEEGKHLIERLKAMESLVVNLRIEPELSSVLIPRTSVNNA